MIAKRIAPWIRHCLRALKKRMHEASDTVTLRDMPPRMMKPVPVECRWRSRGGKHSDGSGWQRKV